jgi:hypothetical protein
MVQVMDMSSSVILQLSHDGPLGAVAPANQPGSAGLTAWAASILEPLVLELRLSRETITGQAERLGYVTAERDAARAELAAAHASQQPVEAPGGPAPIEPSTESHPAPGRRCGSAGGPGWPRC